MISYNSFHIFNLWGRPEFPDQRSTCSLNHNLFPNSADVCLQSTIKCPFLWHLKQSQKQRSLAQPVFDPSPRPFHFGSLEGCCCCCCCCTKLTIWFMAAVFCLTSSKSSLFSPFNNSNRTQANQPLSQRDSASYITWICKVQLTASSSIFGPDSRSLSVFVDPPMHR